MIRVHRPRTAFLLVLALLSISFGSGTAQTITDTGKVPFNAQVRTGTLPNGIPYYILKNARPQNRMELVLTLNVGAVLEDDNQNGFAHFCEHMAFNGTKSFPKNELIGFLESTGIRFGADLNAYTNQDETVYLLTLPTEKPEVVRSGVQVLRDWAGYVTYDTDDINAERGVVVEEWRTRQGAESRVQHEHRNAMYYGSKYAERDVIGDTNVLLRSDAENARRFYRTWYGPQNMAIIAVGDIDVDAFEQLLRTTFVLPDGLEKRTKKRPTVLLPGHADTKFSIASDPELQNASADLWIKHPGDTVVTYADYRRMIVRNLAGQMLNARYAELTQKSKPPFTRAMTAWFGLVRENRMAYASTVAAGKNVLVAFNALLTEIERAERHGFVPTELQRAKDALMANMERYYNERNSTESAQLARELTRHVLERESVPGIEHEYAIYQHYVPQITAEECTQVLREMMTDENRVVTISVPEGNGYVKPTEEQVRNLMAAISSKNIPPYVDDVPTEPLMAAAPTPGKIERRKEIPDLGAEVWSLSNGAVVYVKKTDFKADEILFQSMMQGGQSVGSQDDHLTLDNTADLIDASGIAGFGPTTLQKMLQGTSLSIAPYIDRFQHGLRGQTSPKDMKTFFELIYLYHTQPRIDNDAIASWKTRVRSQLEQRSKNAQAALIDTLQSVMSQHHPRSRQLSAENIDSLNPDLALQFYRRLFAGGSNGVYTFVGNFDMKQLEEYVATYIASLPVAPEQLRWVDDGIRRPHGPITKNVLKGEDPKSFVVLYAYGEAPYTLENRYRATSLAEVLTIRLRELIREDKGGVYSIAAQAMMQKDPEENYGVLVFFGCDPARADELVASVKQEIASLTQKAVGDDYVQKVREIQIKEREVNKATNGFWLGTIMSIVKDGESFTVVKQRDDLIQGLNAAQVFEAAKQYLSTSQVALFVLRPEK